MPFRPTGLSTQTRLTVRLVEELEWLDRAIGRWQGHDRGALQATRPPPTCSMPAPTRSTETPTAAGSTPAIEALRTWRDRSEQAALAAANAGEQESVAPGEFVAASRAQLPRTGARVRRRRRSAQTVMATLTAETAKLVGDACSATRSLASRAADDRPPARPGAPEPQLGLVPQQRARRRRPRHWPRSSRPRWECSTRSGSSWERSPCCGRTRSAPASSSPAQSRGRWPALPSARSSSRWSARTPGSSGAILPLSILIGGLAPAVVSFATGQAAFTVTILSLFTIIAPEGWRIGVVRVEDVASGLRHQPGGRADLLAARRCRPARDGDRRCLRARRPVPLGGRRLRLGVLRLRRCTAGPTDAHGRSSRTLPHAASTMHSGRTSPSAARSRRRSHDITNLLIGSAVLRLTADAVLALWHGSSPHVPADTTQARGELVAKASHVRSWYDELAQASSSRTDINDPLVVDAGGASGFLTRSATILHQATAGRRRRCGWSGPTST